MTVRALIAEDEPILAATLARLLAKLWPEMELVATAANGVAAVEQALATRPDVLFMDIKMPGQTGIEAAEELAERWEGPAPFPHVVFVTAYDDYAVQAFEQAAADYVLKPVNEARLARTVERLQGLLARRQVGEGADPLADPLAELVTRLQALAPPAPAPERLEIVRAAVGNMVRMIPVADVVFFQATDKYVSVVTADSEALIRMPLRDLLPQLDPARFRQVNRSTVVNLACVESAGRDTMGKVTLKLRRRPEKPRVSPVYAHLFRQM
ncbi:MAG: response regulator transcription factor [Lysobacteraceae bacterium]|nr:MAG: response regulator transcription factor [Xanthomonadaceae bacterium]